MANLTDIEKGFLEDAIDTLTRTIGAHPDNDEFFYKRGFTFYLMKNYKQALSDMITSIQLNPKNELSHLMRNMIEKEIADNQP